MAKKWMRVTIDGCRRTAKALVDPEDTWNGFLKPWFPVYEFAAINGMLAEAGVDERLLLYPPTKTATCGEETFRGTEVDGMWLYPIGAGSWVWLEAE